MKKPCQKRHPRRTTLYCQERMDRIVKFGLTTELARRCNKRALESFQYKLRHPGDVNAALAVDLEMIEPTFKSHIVAVDKHIDALIGSENARRILHEGETGETAVSVKEEPMTATINPKYVEPIPKGDMIDAKELLELTAEKLSEKLLSKMFFKF